MLTSRYPTPNTQPDAPNASGIASAITRNPAMPARRNVRRVVLLGATALVSQTYPLYIHQIRPSMSSTCATLVPSRWSTSTVVSWVRVKTKTRSKNSSSVETRIGASTESSVLTSEA